MNKKNFLGALMLAMPLAVLHAEQITLDFENDNLDGSGNALVRGDGIDGADLNGSGSPSTPAQPYQEEGLTITVSPSSSGDGPGVIFDTNRPTTGGSGGNDGDPDLGAPNQGCTPAGPGVGVGGAPGGAGPNCVAIDNILIIQESSTRTNPIPDDSSKGGIIRFDWAYDVNLETLTFLDDVNVTIETYDADDTQLSSDSYNLSTSSYENAKIELSVNESGVRRLDVTFDGSGGIVSAVWTSESDSGDAPDSYGTDGTDSGGEGVGPSHVIVPNLRLGALVDADAIFRPSVGADGDDDSNNNNDEDGVTLPLGDYSAGDTYTATVACTNSTGSLATVYGWIDWNQDGSFDSGERASADCASGAGSSPPLSWTVPNAFDFTQLTYARFRVCTTGDCDSPTGASASGEVEDYLIAAYNLPITLSSVESALRAGGLRVKWTTATETRNVGFHVYGRLEGEEGWQRLSERLIPSKVIDSLKPQRYRAHFGGVVVDELLIEDWDTRGRTERHGPFSVGRRHGFDAVANARDIDWRAIRAANKERRLERRMKRRAKIFSRYASTGARLDDPGVLLWVNQPGVQRVGFDALQDEGANFGGVAIANLALTDDGRAQPRHVIDANANGIFDSGDTIEFVGKIARTLYSARNAYRLRVDPTRVQAANDRTINARKASTGVFRDTAESYHQRAYSHAAPGDDPWYDQRLFAYGQSASLDRSFDLPGYAGGEAMLTLRLWGVTDWPGLEDDHHLVIKVNGERREVWFDGADDATMTIALPAGSVNERDNTLTLEAPGDTGFDWDIQAFDGFSVEYDRRTQAHNGAWQGTIPKGTKTKLQIDGFHGEAVAWKGRKRISGETVLYIKGAGSWVAADTQAIHRPSIQTDDIPAPAPMPGKRAVDYIIISHEQFIDTAAMEDLVTLQQGRGYSTEVIDVRTLYAAYSDFEVDAEAVRRYLKRARPRFVLLVGADSYDYHDYLGLASQSFVPTHYVATSGTITHAPADNRHVDYNGNGVPQAAIGRLPVRTEAELSQLVAKLRDYVPPVQALLSAGPSDEGREFAQISEGYAAQLPDWMIESQVSVDDLDLDGAKTALTDQLNLPGLLVSYVGHSSYSIWGLNPTHGVLLWADEARQMTNTSPHLVTQWGCWNTYFVNPNQDTMANAFLFQEHGAAAVLGATALTDLALLQGLGEEFFNQIGRKPTLGEVLLEAQRRFADQWPNAVDKLRAFTLLGDPAAEL